MSQKRNGKTLFPCLRARMGKWWYYITTMTFSEVDAWVMQVDDIHEKAELKTWIQRELRPERLEQIADYLKTQKQHFFNSIVVGIYGGEPDWYPIRVGGNPAMPTIEISDRAKNTFGFLCLSGAEEIFAIDGQHRVEGVRLAIKHHPKLQAEQQCVIFVSHEKTDKGRIRTRRLFSTLNKYAKPVSKGELVALSEDDTFAIVTRKIIDEYRHLDIAFVPLTKTANIPSSDHRCITTVLALYDLIRVISLPPRSREKRKLEIGPPRKGRVEEIYDATCKFWDLLREFVPEIKEVSDSDPDEEVAKNYRTRGGGHLLFRPVGMKAFARACRILVDRGDSVDDAVELLSRTTLDLNTAPWPGVLWNATARTVLNKNGRLAHNLFLYMAKKPLEPAGYDLLAEYRKALDDEDADLGEIARID